MDTIRPTTPEPGIYQGVPFVDYLAWDAVSNSRLNLAKRSLAHFRFAKFRPPTKALRLGQFIHCGILEPLAVAMRYVVRPEFEKDSRNVTKDGKPSTSKTGWVEEQLKVFRAANEGKELIDRQSYDKLLGVNRALYQHERTREWLTERGETEVSLAWRDPETGLLCKARLDHRTQPRITDLKTTADALKFSKSIAGFGYHRQAAHYTNGWEVLTGEILPFGLIAVEPAGEPFPVRTAPLNEDAMEVGRSEVRGLLRAIANAYERDEWPSYENPKSWVLPAYYEAGDTDIELIIGGQSVSI
jgi:hypothetical protein